MFKRKRDTEAKRKCLVSYFYQDAKITEEYLKIFMNIKFSAPDQAKRTIIITSPSHGEGKTTTTTNLGAAIAHLGEKVLIVDADLRKPTMHHTFKLGNTIGLTSVLLGKLGLDEAAQATGIATLKVLTSGPNHNNPAKLLNSSNMGELIETALNTYDLVLFDTPPFLEVTDANMLANVCQGVIFVVKKGKTKMIKVAECKRLLELTGTKMIGSILNQK
ncbi:CpsD/CapB family tyrosine-protein kinase [Camelliibacillus cellulosilyticus]|uniref:non-specific protein-tyrosine kinase n=1 Tax=Camelliibacillus cellulosilyticus TaxID=2174486 RepID=A0ABV9GS08_9BACL